MTRKLTRRTVLGGLVGVGVAASGVGALTRPTTGAQVVFAVADGSVTTDTGTIDGVTVDVDGTWRFDGVDTPGRTVRIGLGLKSETAPGTWGWEPVAVDEQSITPAHAASGTFEFEDVDLLADTAWTVEDFAAPPNDSVNSATEGQTSKTTVLTLRLLMQVFDGNGKRVVQDEKKTEFTVTVVNEASTGGTGGEGHVEPSGTNEEVENDVE